MTLWTSQTLIPVPEKRVCYLIQMMPLTEDMSYRETVRSVHSFMGWHHIPAFETDYTEPDKSNNPWKGKNPNKPTRVSVAMPPDDWLCQKKPERLNLTVADGYPSRSQDSGGLKRDQFIKVPKTQSKWYKMHMLKPEGPQRPGWSVFSWRNTEAKVNSQFPKITKSCCLSLRPGLSHRSPFIGGREQQGRTVIS